MPLVSIYTNTSPEGEAELLSEVTSLVANSVNKPESITMAKLHGSIPMAFGSNSEKPTALFEIDGIDLSADFAEILTSQLCVFAEKNLNTPADRVFVKLVSTPRGMWGGNGKVY